MEHTERLMKDLGIIAAIEQTGVRSDGRTHVYKVTLTRGDRSMTVTETRKSEYGMPPEFPPTGAKTMQNLCYAARVYHMTCDYFGWAMHTGNSQYSTQAQAQYRRMTRETKALHKLLGSHFAAMCAAALDLD